MSRLFKVVALAMLIVAVTASGAMAVGSMTITTKTIDYKLTTNGAYNVQSSIVAGLAVSYYPLTTLTAGEYVRFTLAGAKFKTGEVVWLNGVSTSTMGIGTCTDSSVVDVAVVSGKTIVAGSPYQLVISTATTTQMPTIIVNAGMAASGVATIAADAYNATGNMYTLSSVAASNLITAVSAANSMTVTMTDDATTANRTIDVNQSRQRFTTTVPGSLTTSFKLAFSPGTADILSVQNNTNFQYTLTVAGDLSGLTYIKIGTNAAVTVTDAFKTAGSAAITGAWLSASTGDGLENVVTNNVVFTVDGSTALSARTFTLSFVLTKTNQTTLYGTAGNITPNVASASATTHVWLINGYQAVMPYGIANATYQTSCYINNPSINAALAYVDIVSTQSGASLTALTNLSLGSIPAYSTRRVTLDTSVTPYLASGLPGTAIALGLPDWDKYSAKFTIQGPNSSVTMNCVQVDSATTKRVVPVLTATSNDYYRQ
ncbi:MAG: hypothetical protein ACOYOS_13155 [Syntrophales bacterium]